jgi:hypothetical protein
MDDNPYRSPEALAPQFTQYFVSTTAYVKAFVVYFLLSTFVGALVGGIVGGVAGGVMGAAGFDAGQVQLLCGLLGLIVAIPVQFSCFRYVIERFILKELNSRLG